MFLRLFRLRILALQISQCDIQGFMPQPNPDCVGRDTFFVRRVSVGLPEAMKFGAFNTCLLGYRLQLPRKCPSGFPLPLGKSKSCGWASRSSIRALIFFTSFAGSGMKRSFALRFFVLPFRRTLPHGFACTCSVFFSHEKSAYSVFCTSASRIQEQRTPQRLFLIHPSEHRIKFLSGIRLDWFLGIAEFRQNLAGDVDVLRTEKSIQRGEDVVDGAVAEVFFVVLQEFHVAQQLTTVSLVEARQLALDGEVEEKSKPVGVSFDGLFALAVLVFPLQDLKFAQPLINGVGDFEPGYVLLVLSNWDIRCQSVKIRLLLLLCLDCRIEVVADRLPRAGSVLKRIPEEIGTRQISWTASGAEIDLLIATIPAFPNLPIQCDCHFAPPNAKYCVGREMTFIRGKIPLKLVAGW